MDLETLARRLDHERGDDRAEEEVVILDRKGRQFDILSLNWDDDSARWVLIAGDPVI